MQNLAEVRLWGKQLGALAYSPDTQLSTFEFSAEWLQTEVEIAPLRMPLSEEKYVFPALPRATFRGLPAAFADSLPDDFGNAVIDEWLARQGRSAIGFNPLERLLYTGQRAMGALEFAPAIRRETNTNQRLELESLVAMAQSVLDQRANVNASIAEPDKGMQSLFQVGTSAGGARAKALIAINPERTQLRSGQTDAPAGFEHYLLKFDGVEESKTGSEVFGDPKGYGRMEYAYYLMARDAGINISPSELLLDGERAHFMTKRFDRADNRKLHYLSLCAMDHADYKLAGGYSYEQLLAVARQLRLSRQDAIEIYRRMVFNVVARNHDDHTKNIGFILDSPIANWRLSPAFDLAYSYKPGSPWVDSHQMSINGKRDDFNRDDLLAVASLIGNFKRQAQEIIEQVTDVVSAWNQYAQRAGVFAQLADRIQSHLRLSL